MTLGEDLAFALPELRQAAESMMVDSCTIGVLGKATFNSSTGTYTAGAVTPVYEGPCRVQVVDSLNAKEPQTGDRQLTIQQLVLSVPIDATGIRVGYVAVIDDATFDPELIDRRFRIVASHAKTHATARRLQCEEITGAAAG